MEIGCERPADTRTSFLAIALLRHNWRGFSDPLSRPLDVRKTHDAGVRRHSLSSQTSLDYAYAVPPAVMLLLRFSPTLRYFLTPRSLTLHVS